MSDSNLSFTAYAVPMDFATLGAMVDTYSKTKPFIAAFLAGRPSKQSVISTLPTELVDMTTDAFLTEELQSAFTAWQSMGACRSGTCAHSIAGKEHSAKIDLAVSKLESSYLRARWQASNDKAGFLDSDVEKAMLEALLAFERKFGLMPYFRLTYNGEKTRAEAYLLLAPSGGGGWKELASERTTYGNSWSVCLVPDWAPNLPREGEIATRSTVKVMEERLGRVRREFKFGLKAWNKVLKEDARVGENEVDLDENAGKPALMRFDVPQGVKW